MFIPLLCYYYYHGRSQEISEGGTEKLGVENLRLRGAIDIVICFPASVNFFVRELDAKKMLGAFAWGGGGSAPEP